VPHIVLEVVRCAVVVVTEFGIDVLHIQVLEVLEEVGGDGKNTWGPFYPLLGKESRCLCLLLSLFVRFVVRYFKNVSSV
jgi:hypothetical protein